MFLFFCSFYGDDDEDVDDVDDVDDDDDDDDDNDIFCSFQGVWEEQTQGFHQQGFQYVPGQDVQQVN